VQSPVAQWPQLVIVVYGSGRVVWDQINRLRAREFDVDLIAVLASVGYRNRQWRFDCGRLGNRDGAALVHRSEPGGGGEAGGAG
jgi:hypothetical protein